MVTRKIRVLEIIASSQGGGTQHLFYLIKGADKSRFDFVVLMPADNDIIVSEFKAHGIKVAILNEFGRFSLQGFFKLLKFIKEEKFDILHFHGTRAAILGRIVAILAGYRGRIVYTIHGFHLPRYPFLKRIPLLLAERFLNRFTDAIICVSYSDKEMIIQKKLVEKEKIEVIWNGIDIEQFQQIKINSFDKKKELDLPVNAFVITMIGRLHPSKDYMTLLSSFRLVMSILPNAYLLIVGEGPLRPKLEQYARSLEIYKRVRFTGFRRDIPALLAITDIFVLSTFWEGLPLALLEAMASAKPVIASDVGGNREIVINGETGLLVPPRDPEILAQAIIELAKNPQKAKEMGKKGFLRVKEHFSLEAMVRKTTKLYERLIWEK